jgi:hypothetical protein
MLFDLHLDPRVARAPIGAEARGLARDFCYRVLREATLINQQAIGAPLRRRVARHPDRRPRGSLLHDLEREWREAIPQQFRLSFQSAKQGNNFFIAERAVTIVDTFRLVHWNGDDYGVAVMETWLKVDRDRVDAGVRSCMWVGSHALARWYQRSGARSDERLLHDINIGATIDADDRETFPDLDDVRVSVNQAAEGWRGAMTLPPEGEGENLVFHARTFV